MVDPELLKLLRCPETHQALRLVDPELLKQLNNKIISGTLLNRAGRPVSPKLDGGLIREDGKILYPVRDKIPVMLIDEGIRLD